MRPIQNYIKVNSLEEAYELNQNRNSMIIAGMMWVRMSKGNIKNAIDLCNLGLNKIEEAEDSYVIGAMTTLRDIETNVTLNSCFNDTFKKALKDIVGVQFRNMATVGGSIWGRFGFSDVLTLFLALDSYVELYKGGIVPLKDFVKMPKDRDIIVNIIVKKTITDVNYMAVRNQSTDLPILTCAVAKDDNMLRASIGARPGKAVLIEYAITNNDFVDYVVQNVPTSGNMRGTAAYRKHLISVLVSRCLDELGGL